MSEVLTYQVEFSDRGPMRITIPASWKITFGAVVPGKGGGAQYGAFGIRIWETAEKQRAVFPNVTQFHLVSEHVVMESAAVRKYGTDDWYRDDGTYGPEWNDHIERDWKDDASSATPSWKAEMQTRLGIKPDYEDLVMPTRRKF